MKTSFLTLAVVLMAIPSLSASEKAIEELSHQKPEPLSEEYLIDMLADDDEYVRYHAATMLGEISDERAILPLIEAFEDEAILVARVASWAVTKCGEAAIEPLIEELQNENRSARMHAVWALGRLKAKKAVGPILESVKDGELQDNDMYTIAWALGSIGDPVLDDLMENLEGPNSKAREISILALGWIESEKATNTLARLLHSDNRRESYFAAEALAWQGDEALDHIFAAAKHKDPHVRRSAARALGLLYDDSAIEPLVALLKDPNEDVRPVAAYSLRLLRHEAALDALIDALRDPEATVRSTAACSLLSNPDKKAFEPLLGLLDDKDPEVRKWAGRALALMKDERALKPLLGLLEDDDPEVVEMTVGSLGILEDARAGEPVLQLLQSEDKSLRWAAISALGSIGYQPALESLLQFASDESMQIEASALISIARIGGDRATEFLLEELKAGDPGRRGRVIFALGFADNEKSVKAVMNDLGRSRYHVRESAAYSAGRLKIALAVPSLLSMLDDPVPDVRIAAACALGGIGTPEAERRLTSAIDELELHIVAGAHDYYIRKGKEGTEEVLIGALYSLNPRSPLASAVPSLYLFSGNSKLERGAREWIREFLSPNDRLYNLPDFSRWGEDSEN